MAVREGSDELRVDLIDVGKGDSLLLEGPEGTTMLIDSGHYHDRGRQVFDHLDERGIDSLDHLVATHDDWDHIGGHAAIVEEFGSEKIGKIYGPKQDRRDEQKSNTRTQYEDALIESGMEEIQLHAGSDVIDLDGVTVDVLNPSSNIDSTARNESSLVMQATYGEQSMLLTGDVGHSTERQLVEKHAEQLSDVDVFKIAHHGSKYSTGKELMETCKPKTVLYSHAEENKHDHPNKETVTRTTQADHAYSTALHGTTSLGFDGQNEITIEHTNDTDLHDATDFAAAIHYQRDNDVALDEIDSIARSDLPANIPYKIVDNASIIEDPQEVQELQEENKSLQNQLDEATESLDAKDDVIDAKDEALDAKDETLDSKDQRIEQLQQEIEALRTQDEGIQRLRERLEALEQKEEQTAHSEKQAASDDTERETTEETAQNNQGQVMGNGSQTTDGQTNSAMEEFRSRLNSNSSQTSLGSEMANNPPKTNDSSETAHSEDESDSEGHSQGQSR